MKTKRYINLRTEDRTNSASIALDWHNNGDVIQVTTANARGALIDSVNINGAKIETSQARQDRENFEHCKHICEELEAYVEGRVYKCPDCGEVFKMPDDVGDKFKCPNCGSVCDVDDYEQQSLYDYFSDMLDIDYVVNYRKEYKACRILVAFGGPNIYIDTFTGYVELYWWTNRAKYQLLSDTVNAIDEWAEEYYNCM